MSKNKTAMSKKAKTLHCLVLNYKTNTYEVKPFIEISADRNHNSTLSVFDHGSYLDMAEKAERLNKLQPLEIH